MYKIILMFIAQNELEIKEDQEEGLDVPDIRTSKLEKTTKHKSIWQINLSKNKNWIHKVMVYSMGNEIF